MSVMRGLSAFPTTPCTPEGDPIPGDLARLLERLAQAGVDSIGLLGSTGSYAYLSVAQRQRVLDLALEAVGGRVPVIVGVGALRTGDAVQLARHAGAAGAAGLLLAPVSYTPLTEDEVFAHFQAVAGTSGLPLCIYNNPSTTRFVFSQDLLARIAAIPGVEAVKMPLPADGDFAAEIAALRPRLPEGFAIGYSGDWGCSRALLDGADAWFSVAAGLWPEATLALTRAAQAGGVQAGYGQAGDGQAGDRQATAEAEDRFRPLWQLFQKHGSLRVVHAAANLLGLTDAQPPRPILPLPEAESPALRAAVAAMEA